MNERGAIATLTLILAPVMLLAGGLAIDGGNILAAKREAAAAADVAARAGAQALDTERLRA
ncbi:MAG: pilus assembly protein TadG-related protein, partial [Solirubrobacterales bacterium]